MAVLDTLQPAAGVPSTGEVVLSPLSVKYSHWPVPPSATIQYLVFAVSVRLAVGVNSFIPSSVKVPGASKSATFVPTPLLSARSVTVGAALAWMSLSSMLSNV